MSVFVTGQSVYAPGHHYPGISVKMQPASSWMAWFASVPLDDEQVGQQNKNTAYILHVTTCAKRISQNPACREGRLIVAYAVLWRLSLFEPPGCLTGSERTCH
jgi:hypothetical protein